MASSAKAAASASRPLPNGGPSGVSASSDPKRFDQTIRIIKSLLSDSAFRDFQDLETRNQELQASLEQERNRVEEETQKLKAIQANVRFLQETHQEHVDSKDSKKRELEGLNEDLRQLVQSLEERIARADAQQKESAKDIKRVENLCQDKESSIRKLNASIEELEADKDKLSRRVIAMQAELRNAEGLRDEARHLRDQLGEAHGTLEHLSRFTVITHGERDETYETRYFVRFVIDFGQIPAIDQHMGFSN
jgi:chromosome segregation ATPase